MMLLCNREKEQKLHIVHLRTRDLTYILKIYLNEEYKYVVFFAFRFSIGCIHLLLENKKIHLLTLIAALFLGGGGGGFKAGAKSLNMIRMRDLSDPSQNAAKLWKTETRDDCKYPSSLILFILTSDWTSLNIRSSSTGQNLFYNHCVMSFRLEEFLFPVADWRDSFSCAQSPIKKTRWCF